MEVFPLTITAWTAVIMAGLMLWLTAKVISQRRKEHIILGENDDHVFTKKVRGQANAAEQIPVALIMLGLTELLQPAFVTLIIAAILVIGRLMHGVYFAIHGTNHRLRVYGMMLTLLAQSLAIIAVALGLLI